MKFLNFLKNLLFGKTPTKIADVQETPAVETKAEASLEVFVPVVEVEKPKVKKVKADKPVETAKDIKSKAKKPVVSEDKPVEKKLPALKKAKKAK